VSTNAISDGRVQYRREHRLKDRRCISFAIAEFRGNSIEFFEQEAEEVRWYRFFPEELEREVVELLRRAGKGIVGWNERILVDCLAHARLCAA
jgi:hypothetical protein